MNRRAKGPAFKMRSGNKTSFKKMGSTSPLYKPKGMTGLTKEERQAKREKFREDIKQFGKGLEGALKDVKHALVDDPTKEAMIEKGYETKATRKEKYGTTSFDPAKGYGVEKEPKIVTSKNIDEKEDVSELNVAPVDLKFDIGTSMPEAFKQATKAGAQLGDIFHIGDEKFRYQFEGDYTPPHLKGKK